MITVTLGLHRTDEELPKWSMMVLAVTYSRLTLQLPYSARHQMFNCDDSDSAEHMSDYAFRPTEIEYWIPYASLTEQLHFPN